MRSICSTKHNEPDLLRFVPLMSRTVSAATGHQLPLNYHSPLIPLAPATITATLDRMHVVT